MTKSLVNKYNSLNTSPTKWIAILALASLAIMVL